MLKTANRPRFTESSDVRIRAFLDEAEVFLECCERPRDRWGRFVLSWLGVNEAEKVRRSHLNLKLDDYVSFREGLVTLFGRHEFEDTFRQSLRVLRQSGSESISDYAARTTDLCSRAYPSYTTDEQLDLAVECFISGIADESTRTYLRRERARRPIVWQEAVRMAQASEVPRLLEQPTHAAATGNTANVPESAPIAKSGTIGDGDIARPKSSTCAAVESATTPACCSTGAHGGRPHLKKFSGKWRTGAPTPSARDSQRAPAQQSEAANFVPASHSRANALLGLQRSRAPACFACGGSGHKVSACQGVPDGARFNCYECGGVGHFARVCPTRASAGGVRVSYGKSTSGGVIGPVSS